MNSKILGSPRNMTRPQRWEDESERMKTIARRIAEKEASIKWWESVKDLPAPRLENPLARDRKEDYIMTKRGSRCLPLD